MLIGGAAGITAALAGCTESVPFVGDEPMEFGASVATVPDTALSEAGYEEDVVEELVIEESVGFLGRSQDVIVENWQANYEKPFDPLDIGLAAGDRLEAGVFVALSTPQISILGRPFNPVADMESEELAEMVQEHYDGLEGLEAVGEETTSMLGEEATITEFEGEAELLEAGARVDLTLHISEPVESGEDLVIAIGGYPSAAVGERDHVFDLTAAIDHDE